MKESIDFLIVGAGYAGLVLAERLCAGSGQTCVVIDKRDHIGGNAYDYHDAAGVLVHKYGPHYFRTNAPRIREYLSSFTEWHPVAYTIKSFSRGRYWSFPINLNTFEEMTGRPSTSEEMAAYLERVRVPIEVPRNSEEVIISQVGWELYEMFFKNYTIKQWKRHPRDLDASVCGRIPIRTDRDDRYLSESFQALPKYGYTEMFRAMIDRSPGLEVRLNTTLDEVRDKIRFRHLIYTGPIDAYYEHRFGVLPYRSLRFEHESFSREQLLEHNAELGAKGFWQPALQVNYPNSEDFTRIVEIKHATGQPIPATTIVREYPQDHTPQNEPYYPVPAPDAKAVYARYKELADKETKVSFVGRLATYRYYNMDQVVGMALAEYNRLVESGIAPLRST